MASSVPNIRMPASVKPLSPVSRSSRQASIFWRNSISSATGIPPQVVMKWTGHSDYKAMRSYIDIAEKVKAEQMSIFEKGLKG